MDKQKKKRAQRQRRHHRVRAKVKGEAGRPRVAVFRSANHIYSQAIDDRLGKTISAVNDLKLSGKNKTERSAKAGELLADKLKKQGIERIIFDRGGFKYHGRIKALAESLRKMGIKF